jgi:outer membrane protein assembly factor BamB
MRLLAVLFIAVFLNACSTVGDFFGDEPYENPAAELTEFEIEFNPTVIWKTNVGEGAKNNYSDLSIAVDDESIFTVDYEGQVTRLLTASGSRAWQTELDIPVYSGVGSNNSLIFVGSQEGQVFALNKVDGNVVWQKSVSSEVLAAPQANQTVVVVRTSDGRLSGLSTENGTQLWSYQRAVPLLSLRGAGVPVIDDDKVIAGYANGKIVALSIEDGKVIWEKKCNHSTWQN